VRDQGAVIIMAISAIRQDQLAHCQTGGIPAAPTLRAITRLRGPHLDIPPYSSHQILPGYEQPPSILSMADR
jgi:hypothetical protein